MSTDAALNLHLSCLINHRIFSLEMCVNHVFYFLNSNGLTSGALLTPEGGILSGEANSLSKYMSNE